MTVKVAFAAGNAQRIMVPAAVLVRRGEIDGVYVIGADNSVGLRLVRLGHRNGDDIEVLSGLAAGERIARDPEAAVRWLVGARASGNSP
jgi:multidrug efflux pump subunit AcrA (membrane-fusion protein)